MLCKGAIRGGSQSRAQHAQQPVSSFVGAQYAFSCNACPSISRGVSEANDTSSTQAHTRTATTHLHHCIQRLIHLSLASARCTTALVALPLFASRQTQKPSFSPLGYSISRQGVDMDLLYLLQCNKRVCTRVGVCCSIGWVGRAKQHSINRSIEDNMEETVRARPCSLRLLLTNRAPSKQAVRHTHTQPPHMYSQTHTRHARTCMLLGTSSTMPAVLMACCWISSMWLSMCGGGLQRSSGDTGSVLMREVTEKEMALDRGKQDQHKTLFKDRQKAWGHSHRASEMSGSARCPQLYLMLSI